MRIIFGTGMLAGSFSFITRFVIAFAMLIFLYKANDNQSTFKTAMIFLSLAGLLALSLCVIFYIFLGFIPLTTFFYNFIAHLF